MRFSHVYGALMYVPLRNINFRACKCLPKTQHESENLPENIVDVRFCPKNGDYFKISRFEYDMYFFHVHNSITFKMYARAREI